ncbi:hypothetical protein SprV_0200707900 [Sparganum proliferum]
MAVSGCANCLRVLTIIFNFVVFLCGILLVAFASYVLHQFNTVFYGLKAQEYGVVIGPSDYGAAIPESCGTSTVGCAQLAEDYIRGHSTTLFIVAIVVALLQLAAVIVACCLQSNIRKYQTV